jgi:hypothetical protein
MAREATVKEAFSTEKKIADPAVWEIVEKGPSAHDFRSGQPFLFGKIGAGDRS